MQETARIQLLIAEDSAVVRERLVALAREHLPANSICSVATGTDAVAVFDRSNPDAVLLDLGLPDVSGLEVLEHIRRRGTSTEVIIFTNWSAPEMAARCHLLGANHFVSKANDIGPVIEILKTIATPTDRSSSPERPAASPLPKQAPPSLPHRPMGFQPIAVLLVEDDLSQAEPFLKLLRPKLPSGSSVMHAGSRAEALAQLRAGFFEVVLLDLGLPDSQGVEAAEILRAEMPDLAIIVLSARDDDLTVEAAMHAGADDYFVKGELDIAGVARAVIAAAKGKRAARALTIALESRRRIMDSSADVICTLDAVGRFVEVGAACERLWGYTREELIGRLSTEWIEPAERTQSDEALEAVRRSATTHEFENRFICKDGSSIEMGWSAIWSLPDRLMYCVARDITERKRSDEALRRSEERFSAAFEFAPMGIAIVDLEGRWVRVNQSLCELLGYSSTRLIGKPLRDVTHENYHATDLAVRQRLLAGEFRFYHHEKRFTHKDGKVVWVLLGVSVIRNSAGEPLHFVMQMQDISERKVAEEALVTSERDLRALAARLEGKRERLASAQAVAKIGSWETNFQTRAVIWSAETYRIFGITPDDFGSTHDAFLELVHPADRARVDRAFMDCDGQCHVEHRITSPGAGSKHVEERWEVIRNGQGKPIRATGTCQDITERKRAERDLERLNKQLLETSRQAGMAEVATSVLHNVGNVLNSVNVSCSVISDTVRQSRITTVKKTAELLRQHASDLPAFLTTDPAGKKLPELLSKLAQRLSEEQATVLSEAQALTQNVEHIKDIVAVQQSYARDLGGLRETLGLESLMEDALRMNSASLIRHRVEIVRDFEPAPPVSLEKHKVLQILVNLLRNAKHALGDSPREDKRVILRIRSNEHEVAASVIDNGIGIAPENMTRIFAHGFTTKKDGHGFGLHSGALAAQGMGGSLTVQSDGLGHGAVFTLLLPISPDADGARKEVRQP